MSRLNSMGNQSSSRFSLLCFFLIRFICVTNVGTSVILFSSKQVSLLVQASSISDDHSIIEWISYLSYAVTFFLSIIALVGATCWSLYFILPLWLWDSMRLVFTLSCIAPSRTEFKTPDNLVLFYQYAALLLVCILVELFCINESPFEYDRNCLSFLTESDGLDLRRTNQSTFHVRYPPRIHGSAPPPYSSIVDIAPPPYSSIKLSSPSTPVLPAATFFTKVPGHPVRAAISPEEPPPPYEFQGCSGNPPYSPKSYEQFQQQMNLCFSTHIDPL